MAIRKIWKANALADIGSKPLKTVYKQMLQVSASGEIADLSGSGTGIYFTGGGHIYADGAVHAQEYIVSSSVTSMSFAQSSGSTIFGDTNDDTHQFTGSMYVSGAISSIGENYQVQLNHGAAGGPFISLGGPTDPDAYLKLEASYGQNRLTTTTRDFHLFGTNTTTGFYLDEGLGNFGIKTLVPSASLDVNGNLQVQSHITASGNISSSGHISASGLNILTGTTSNDMRIFFQ
jgi:hypothetical protein